MAAFLTWFFIVLIFIVLMVRAVKVANNYKVFFGGSESPLWFFLIVLNCPIFILLVMLGMKVKITLTD